MKPMKIVEVMWWDTVTSDGWEQTYIRKAAEVVSVGYLCERTDKGIMLVQSLCDPKDTSEPYSGSIFIPAGCIQRVRVIRKKEDKP